MMDFVSLCCRFLANRFLRHLCVTGAVYVLYVIYVGVNYMVVPVGLDDPVYRLTGIPRTEQLASASMLFGIAVMALLIRHMARDGRPLDFASSPAIRRGTVLLVAFIFLNGVAASLAAVLSDLNSQFWTPLFAWVAAVLALQILLVYALLSRVRQPRIQLAAMAALSVFNLFALYLSLLGAFLSMPVMIQAAVMAFALLGFAALFAAAGKHIVPARTINAVLVLTMIGPVAAIALSWSAAPVITGRMAPFGDIEFRTRPNIHIVSVDALIPRSLAKKHMGLSDLPYDRLLEGDGVVVFKNAFASQVATKLSLNSLMRLAHPDFAGDFGYFAGRTDGPVTHVLHANGYTVSTGFNQLYFGAQGPFVDSYLPAPTRAVRNSSLCALASGSPLKFFWFCGLGSLIAEAEPTGAWPDTIMEIIGRAATAPAAPPTFTLHYIVNPIGHTAKDYRSSDRRAIERYARRYSSGAARVTGIMERLQDIVRNDEAPSILMVMGDHGPFLSRTVSPNDDPTYVVQDQYGILAAVLVNNTDCTAEQLRYYTKTYATPARILAGVIRCLARDPAGIDTAMKFDEAYEFKNFLYE